MWTHEIAQTEDPADDPVEYEQLSIGDWIDLEVVYEDGPRLYVQAVNDCGDYVNLGYADDPEEGKRTAERWALAQIVEMLRAVGAEGIWLIRGAAGAMLAYTAPDSEGEIQYMPALTLERPMERILLIRFPAGDGGEGGIEYL
jgi:hypothetical protein